MTKRLNEQKLKKLFQTHLPPVEMPEEFAARLETHVLQEVERTLGKRNAAETSSSGAGSLRARLERLAEWPAQFARSISWTLAGATVAVLLLFTILLPRLLTPQETTSRFDSADEIVLEAPASPAVNAAIVSAQTAVLLIQRGATGAVETIQAGEEARLDQGDIVQTNDGSAEIRFSAARHATLSPYSRVRLMIPEVQNSAAAIVLLQESGMTRHQITRTESPAAIYEVRTAAMRALTEEADFTVTVPTVEESVIETAGGMVTVETSEERIQIEGGQIAEIRTGTAPLVQASEGNVTQVAQRPLPADASITPAQSGTAASLRPDANPTVISSRTAATQGATPTNSREQSMATADETPSALTAVLPTSTLSVRLGANGDRGSATSTPARRPSAMPNTGATATASPTRGASRLPTATPTPRQTAARPTQAATKKALAREDITPAATPSPSKTPTKTATRTPTRPPAKTPSKTPSRTPGQTPTRIPTRTPTGTPTALPSPTATSTARPNAAPVAVADAAVTAEEQSVTIALLGNDYDADQDELVLVDLTQPAHGRASNLGNGLVSYTPALNFAGEDTFTYRISDGEAIAGANVTVAVTPVNDAPTVLAASEVRLEEDATGTLIVTLSDVDNDPATLTLSVAVDNETLVAPDGMTVSGAGSERTVEIRPLPDRTGNAVITLTVDDGLTTVSRTVAVTVAPINDLPQIEPPGDRQVEEDGSIEVPLTVSDVDDDAATLVVTAAAADGTLIAPDGMVMTGDGGQRTLRITPAANRYGTTEITVTVRDSIGFSQARFLLTVAPVNDAPVIGQAADQTVAEDGRITLALTLADADGDPLTLTASSDNPALLPEGALTLEGAGTTRTLLIVPAANQSGTARITLTASDGQSSGQSAFTLTVTPVNDAPTLSVPQEVSLAEDSVSEMEITVGDVDHDPAALTLSVASNNALLLPEDALQLSGEGAQRVLRIAPAANQSGTAEVTVTVSDGTLTTEQRVIVTVDAVNDPPAPMDDAAGSNGEAILIPVLDNDGDAEQDALRIVEVGAPEHGATAVEGNAVRYTPAAEFSGVDRFSYSVSDGELSTTAWVEVTVVRP